MSKSNTEYVKMLIELPPKVLAEMYVELSEKIIEEENYEKASKLMLVQSMIDGIGKICHGSNYVVVLEEML